MRAPQVFVVETLDLETITADDTVASTRRARICLIPKDPDYTQDHPPLPLGWVTAVREGEALLALAESEHASHSPVGFFSSSMY